MNQNINILSYTGVAFVVLYAVFFLIFGSLYFISEYDFNKLSSQETLIQIEDDSENVNLSNESLSWNCSVCKRSFQGRGFEEDMNGNWIPCKDPVQCLICSPACGRRHVDKMNSIAKEYGIDLEEESLPSEDGGYYMGDDGRVYENSNCGLCNGTGFEKGRSLTGETQVRICPMCEGRGARSY